MNHESSRQNPKGLINPNDEIKGKTRTVPSNTIKNPPHSPTLARGGGGGVGVGISIDKCIIKTLRYHSCLFWLFSTQETWPQNRFHFSRWNFTSATCRSPGKRAGNMSRGLEGDLSPHSNFPPTLFSTKSTVPLPSVVFMADLTN